MKNLLIYYSKTANNELLALELSRKLNCDCEEISEVRKRTFFTLIREMAFRKAPKINDIKSAVENYDNVILVSPVWGGIPATPMIAFINKYKNSIKKYSFVTVSGGALGENHNVENFLVKKTGKKPLKITQLYINDLLPPEKKNKTKQTSSYKITEQDLSEFKNQLDDFVCVLTKE